MAGLPRELLKWLQSLDLTWQVKMTKWDLTNGFLIAEIFSWYYPQEIQMHSYNNGTSLDSKLRNWSLLRIFMKRHKMSIPEELVEGTIHSKEGAAQLLIERIYEILTNRTVKKLPLPHEIDFTDRAYQNRLAPHARSTASQAIKNNIKVTEMMNDQNHILSQQKSQHIINSHILHRAQERYDDPARFDIRPTLGELCPRSAPRVPEPLSTESTMIGSPVKLSPVKPPLKSPLKSVSRARNEPPRSPPPSPINYREISVNQSEPPKPLHRPINADC